MTPQVNTLEKHVQSGLGMIMVLLLAWAGVSLNELQKQAAMTAVEVTRIKDDISEIKAQNRSVYTRAEAVYVWGEHREDFRRLTDRVRLVEVTGKAQIWQN
jgi:hypothetical protein